MRFDLADTEKNLFGISLHMIGPIFINDWVLAKPPREKVIFRLASVYCQKLL